MSYCHLSPEKESTNHPGMLQRELEGKTEAEPVYFVSFSLIANIYNDIHDRYLGNLTTCTIYIFLDSELSANHNDIWLLGTLVHQMARRVVKVIVGLSS